ncbi:MAG: 4Fe-4S dicluster domain-containing protein [Candidatus Latescibacteria bacterium]|nr:4Fe-4S dicluster domain-containing protein [Candidatus Latescibacterota bacterium]NIM21401.1 4Fe-4S dicluster domain-containing protein [Candidatus Latescibacterota bacterium]NIM65582.1 4Fe-4S dicluster domain-containing protein [Candidatus Latescibacterota bacterium]NIO01962.1 4Fe-4S dicluster domain-containing protein [Candidatus Latescibacterota bacterium]NIO28775.1 4Fe-4S dicluster domain-containing protein [Candidatus Latescibacterota bacterium]
MQPGHVPANIIFAIVFVAAIGFFILTVRRLYKTMRLGKPEDRFDGIGDRLKGVATFVFGQRRVVSEPSGWGHFFIFWGFIIITLGTLETFGVGIHRDFAYWKFLGKGFAAVLYLLQDLFCAAVIVAMLVAIYRRLMIKPERLKYENQMEFNLDAGIIIVLILVLVVLALGARSIEYHLAQADPGGYFPQAAFISVALSPIFNGLTERSLHIWYSSLWWGHTLVVFGFLIYIPFSKHLHLLGAIVNVFFRRFRPIGELTKMDLEDETVETYGVSNVESFTWKQLLDLYACTYCGRCSQYCPATLTGKPLSPKLTIHHLKDHLIERGALLLTRQKGREKAETTDANNESAKALIGDVCLHDELWSCTTCAACMEHCPVFIEHIDKYVDMRRHLVLMESNFPTEAQTALRGWETNSNPWGISADSRGDWAEDLPVKILSQDAEVEYLFYVGCAGSFDARGKKVATAMVKLLNEAGISFGILGPEEKCCGETARRIGNEYLFQTMATELAETINRYGVEKIVTTCPHGYNTLKNEYPQFGGNWEVYHHSELLAELAQQGRIRPVHGIDKNVVFHDSCYLGRYNSLYDEPRLLLKSLPGLHFKEMEHHRNKAFCCGAGGGRMWMEETLGDKKINDARTEQALSLEPDIIGVCCPFCTTMFEDGLKACDMEEKVLVRDVAELLAQSITSVEKE